MKKSIRMLAMMALGLVLLATTGCGKLQGKRPAQQGRAVLQERQV